jgi:acyl carrier protein
MLLDDGRQYFPFAGPARGQGAFTSEDEKKICEALKRCSAPTRAAACAYRRTRDAGQLPLIVHGLIEHYVERNIRIRLGQDADDIRLVEDLAIDSLTMLEIVYLAEEVLQVSIDNEDLRAFRTVGEVKRYMVSKLAPTSQVFCDFKGAPAMGTLPKISDPYDKREH